MLSRKPFLAVVLAIAVLAIPASAGADTLAQSTPFAQSWTNTGLITSDDNWNGVAGIVGRRGDDLTMTTATDPRTILADGAATPLDLIANQVNPILTTGGIAEFELANPTVALQATGTADAPHLVVALTTAGHRDITFKYRLRDIDGSTDDTVQPVDLQYRVGGGSWASVGGGFVADATSGPSQATLETPVEVKLPAEADDKPLVELRVITTNAPGNDEWVGVDDITATSTPLATTDPGGGSAAAGGGASGGDSAVPPAPTKKPFKCRKGFRKKQVKGKQPRCVKKRKQHHKRGR